MSRRRGRLFPCICGRRACFRIVWRSSVMPAVAFWHTCGRCTLRSRATFKKLRTPFLVERLSTQPRTKTQWRKWETMWPRKWRRAGLLTDVQIARLEAEGLL